MRLSDFCLQCGAPVVVSRYDLTYRFEDDTERLVFDMPGALCQSCMYLAMDPSILQFFQLDAGRCVQALESDRSYMERTEPSHS